MTMTTTTTTTTTTTNSTHYEQYSRVNNNNPYICESYLRNNPSKRCNNKAKYLVFELDDPTYNRKCCGVHIRQFSNDSYIKIDFLQIPTIVNHT